MRLTRQQSEMRKRLIELMWLEVEQAREQYKIPKYSEMFKLDKWGWMNRRHKVVKQYPGRWVWLKKLKGKNKGMTYHAYCVHKSLHALANKWWDLGLDIRTLQLTDKALKETAQ